MRTRRRPFFLRWRLRRLFIDKPVRYYRLARYIIHRQDWLTNVPNPYTVRRRFRRALSRSKRSQQTCVLIKYDVDKIKDTMDRYGLYAGDAVLREIGALMNQFANNYLTMLFGRIAGDEFAMLLPNTSLADGLAVADQFRQLVADHHVYFKHFHEQDEYELPATVSAGVVAAPGRKASLDSLFRQADAALQRAKEAGRNRVVAATG